MIGSITGKAANHPGTAPGTGHLVPEPNALVAAVLAALFITEDDLTGLLVLDP